MGYQLEGAGGEITFAQSIWPPVLAVAAIFGWQPQGTIPDKESGIFPGRASYGAYEYNDGQLVTAEDAHNLGEAIEKALLSLFIGVKQGVPQTDSDKVRTEEEQRAIQRVMEYDPEGDKLKRFVRFCKAGAFTIH